jgi:hypothetical protein
VKEEVRHVVATSPTLSHLVQAPEKPDRGSSFRFFQPLNAVNGRKAETK